MAQVWHHTCVNELQGVMAQIFVLSLDQFSNRLIFI